MSAILSKSIARFVARGMRRDIAKRTRALESGLSALGGDRFDFRITTARRA